MAVVGWHVDGPVATAVLDDPQRRNALSTALRAELDERFAEFERRDDLRVLILASSGPVFCAGGDLADMPDDVAGAGRFLTDILWWLATPERLRKPVIAAVDGPTLGGGLELAIACDMIVAGEQARFGTPEALVGLAPAFAMVRLDRILGPALTKEMAFTGRQLTAAEAERLGLVNRVVAAGTALAGATALAGEVLRGAPLSQMLVKSVLNRDLGGAGLAHSRDGMAQLFASQDVREGLAAFAAKRAPRFVGR
jgi:enoyl-CoA hydratase/carnithine racemase